jgi:N-methylhydantoinase A
VRTYYKQLLEADFAELAAIHEELAATGAAAMEAAGVPPELRNVRLQFDVRYVGQEFALQVPVSTEDLARGEVSSVIEAFNTIHARRFGHAAPSEPLELVNVRLTAIGSRPKIAFPEMKAADSDPRIGTRSIYLDGSDVPTDCAVYRRDRLKPGVALDGPCVIEEYASTTVLFAGDTATMAPTGELIIKVGQA